MGDAFATAQTLADQTTADATTKNVATQSEADIFEPSSKLALANSALDATLTAAAQSFSLSLIDKLGGERAGALPRGAAAVRVRPRGRRPSPRA